MQRGKRKEGKGGHCLLEVREAGPSCFSEAFSGRTAMLLILTLCCITLEPWSHAPLERSSRGAVRTSQFRCECVQQMSGKSCSPWHDLTRYARGRDYLPLARRNASADYWKIT